MTLAARIAQMVQLGHRTPAHTARQIIAEVRDHDARLLDQIRVRDLPVPDCPEACVVGAEWRRQAEHARHEIQQLRSDLLHATREDGRGRRHRG